jgi:hypothetical protein
MGPPPPPAHWLSNPSRQEGSAPPGQPRSTRPRERARCHLLTDSGIVLPIPEKFQRSAQLPQMSRRGRRAPPLARWDFLIRAGRRGQPRGYVRGGRCEVQGLSASRRTCSRQLCGHRCWSLVGAPEPRDEHLRV